MATDWSSLPPDLLRAVANDLSDPADFIHFRAVCTHWRTFVSLADAPTFLPCLLTIHGAAAANLSFFFLTSGALRSFRIPNYLEETMHVKATADGCLLAVGDPAVGVHREMPVSLFNPLITGARVDLPGLPWLHDGATKFTMTGGRWATQITRAHRPGVHYLSARLLMADGGRWRDDAMAICYARTGFLAFCRPGDAGWTAVVLPVVPTDIAVRRGGQILVGEEKAVHVLDTTAMAFVARLQLRCLNNPIYRFVESVTEVLVTEKAAAAAAGGLATAPYYVHRASGGCAVAQRPCGGVNLEEEGMSVWVGLRGGAVSVPSASAAVAGGSVNWVVEKEGRWRVLGVRRWRECGAAEEMEITWSEEGEASWLVPTLNLRRP